MNFKELDPIIATLIRAVLIIVGTTAAEADNQSLKIAGAVTVLLNVAYGVWNACHKKQLAKQLEETTK